jgi:peptidoglycan/xylan/chitin deacetylase (PgdA/CDA1 family)
MKNKAAKKIITIMLIILSLAASMAIPNMQNGQVASAVIPDVPRKVAYLTFDDGPYREITPYILDILKQEGIPATFFVLPFEGVDDIYRRIINEGHELGNHSYTHNYRLLYREPIEVFAGEIERAHEFILDNFGYTMTSFRFPGGPFGHPASVFEERREIIARMGYREFAWHIDSGDSRADVRNKGAEEIVRRVLDNTRDREHLIILFHDVPWSPMTLEALPYVIAGLRKQGYTFDVVSNYPLSEEERAMQSEQQRERNESKISSKLRKLLTEKSIDSIQAFA